MSGKTVINIKADREEVTFSATHTMTPELETVLQEVEHDRKTGKNIKGPFAASEAVKYLSGL